MDLGCGYGWHCKYAAQMGATEILGIDSSQKMIAKAVADNSDDKIKYKVCSVEEYIYPENTYDLVVSNLVLHYIENLANVYQKVYCTLKVGGYFLFNIEHPTWHNNFSFLIYTSCIVIAINEWSERYSL